MGKRPTIPPFNTPPETLAKIEALIRSTLSPEEAVIFTQSFAKGEAGSKGAQFEYEAVGALLHMALQRVSAKDIEALSEGMAAAEELLENLKERFNLSYVPIIRGADGTAVPAGTITKTMNFVFHIAGQGPFQRYRDALCESNNKDIVRILHETLDWVDPELQPSQIPNPLPPKRGTLLERIAAESIIKQLEKGPERTK